MKRYSVKKMQKPRNDDKSVALREIAAFLTSERLEFQRKYNPYHNITYAFFVPEYDLLIEYHTPEYFNLVDGIKSHDKIKAEEADRVKWAADNGKKYLRIPHFKSKNIPMLICEKIDEIAPI